MRYPNLSKSVTIGGNAYSVAAMLREFVWGNPYWSTDEGTRAAFDRLTAKPEEQSEEDFGRVVALLRQLNFPAHASIECAALRNAFILDTQTVAPNPAKDTP